jgi:hypothetical protein
MQYAKSSTKTSTALPFMSAAHRPLSRVSYSKHWCPGRDLNPHFPCEKKDFKSFASADFATRAARSIIINTRDKHPRRSRALTCPSDTTVSKAIRLLFSHANSSRLEEQKANDKPYPRFSLPRVAGADTNRYRCTAGSPLYRGNAAGRFAGQGRAPSAREGGPLWNLPRSAKSPAAHGTAATRD